MLTLQASSRGPRPLAGRLLKEQPFFIFGCPRSGTSLLSTILGTHPRLAIPNESHLYNIIYPIARRYGEPTRQPARTRLVAEILRTEYIRRWTPPPSLPETLQVIERYDFHGIVEGIMQAWAQGQGKVRWGEKTPQHTLCWRTISAGFPGLRVLHLIRDGRDVALSYKAAFFGPKHVYSLARRWLQYLAAAEEAGAALGEQAFLQVRYEDLVGDPERELRRICSFLGEPFAPSMLAFHQASQAYHIDQRNARNLRLPIISHNSDKWRTGMTAREVRIFEALAGAALERYGYERSLRQPHISAWESISCRYLEHPPKRLSAMLKNRQARRLALEKLRLHFSMLAENSKAVLPEMIQPRDRRG